MTRIIVVGSANVDFVVKTPHIPSPGETVLGRDFMMVMGGKGANQAVGAARLGADVTFITCIGQDIFGDQCLAAYQNEGIATEFIKRDADDATGVALIAVAESGENSITVASGANMQLLPTDVEKASKAFETADALLVQLEVPIDTILSAARLARKYGLKVILNPAPAQLLSSELLRNVDVITPNHIEARQILGISEAESVANEYLGEKLQGKGLATTIITLGGDGALLMSQSDCMHVPSFKVEAIDTTAAGDAFNAGLTVAMAQKGTSLVQAVRYACACGALATTQVGAQTSLPTQQQVAAFIAAN